VTAATTPAPTPVAAEAPTTSRRPSLRGGWMIVGTKEFGDHLLSVRFFVLFFILALAAAVPLYFVSGDIRTAASSANAFPALFIGLFWFTPQVNDQITLPSVVGFLAMVGPLLGLAFAFDAINGERAEGTLPRLLSQPIHRDDVINGKFAAGLAIISMVLVVMVAAVAAFALVRMGIIPKPNEILRVVLWLLLTFVYVSLWLAFGMLLSVVVRRAATSALIGFGAWLLLTFFGGLIVTLLGGVFTSTATTDQQQLANIGVQETLSRLLPDTLYREASLVLLNPQVTTVSTPATIAGYAQAQQRIPSLLSLDQSFILVWPQVVALVALTTACFALAYVLFMRQEVRA
jgi:ABC-2 type transport system permease protein